MFQLLYKYLILQKKVSMPGIGVFSFHRQPATHDFIHDVFAAPALQIVFTPGASEAAPNFYSYVSSKQQLTEAEAMQHYDDFILRLKKDLDLNGKVSLPGLGELSKKDTGEIHFAATNQLHDYFPAVAAAKVGQHDAEQKSLPPHTRTSTRELQKIPVKKHQVIPEKNNYWWIYAIVLALIGIAAIFFYYTINGSFE